LKNINCVPSLNSIKVSLFSEANISGEKKDIIKLKEFLFLYFFSSSLPLIKYHFKSKDRKELLKTNSEDLKFSFITSRKQAINDLFVSIFTENYSRLVSKNSLYNYQSFEDSSSFKLTTLVPIRNLFDLEYLYNSEVSMAYKESVITVSFFFKSYDKKKKTSIKNFFKLYPFFNLL